MPGHLTNLRQGWLECVLNHSVGSDSLQPPWSAHQAPLSVGFSRQEYWSGLPCPPLGDLPDPGIVSVSLYDSCIGRQVKKQMEKKMQWEKTRLQWGKTCFFHKWGWEKWIPSWKRMKPESDLVLPTKTYLKWIKDLNVTPES